MPRPPSSSAQVNSKYNVNDDEEDIHAIRSSFQDLVIYNDQGQPSLDLDRLIYTPPTKTHGKEKERLSWYVPDYAFIVCNFISLACATYYVLNGLTIMTWRNTMHWFRFPSQFCDNTNQTELGETNSDEVCTVLKAEYQSAEKAEPYTIIRFKGFSDPGYHGLVMLCIGCCTYFNVIAGFHGCIDGSRNILAFHLTFDIVLFVIEVALVALLKGTGHCEDKDINVIAAFLLRMINNYGVNKDLEVIRSDTIQLDLIQVSLACCGVGNWTDYLPRSSWDPDGNITLTTSFDRYNVDQSELIFPSSCCQQWWARNIYCGQAAHLWAYPTASDLHAHQFRQRINQLGCLPKMVGLCTNMVGMAGTGGIIVCGIHLILTIAKQLFGTIQIRRLDTLIRERKRIFKHRNRETELEQMGKENNEDLFPSFASLFALFGASEAALSPSRDLPNPPGEQDMVNYKARKDMNALLAKAKGSHVEGWVDSGKQFVEGGQGKKRKPREKFEHKLVVDDEFWKKINEVTRQREEPDLKARGMDQKTVEYGRPTMPVADKKESVNALDAIKLLQQVKKPILEGED